MNDGKDACSVAAPRHLPAPSEVFFDARALLGRIRHVCASHRSLAPTAAEPPGHPVGASRHAVVRLERPAGEDPRQDDVAVPTRVLPLLARLRDHAAGLLPDGAFGTADVASRDPHRPSADRLHGAGRRLYRRGLSSARRCNRARLLAYPVHDRGRRDRSARGREREPLVGDRGGLRRRRGDGPSRRPYRPRGLCRHRCGLHLRGGQYHDPHDVDDRAPNRILFYYQAGGILVFVGPAIWFWQTPASLMAWLMCGIGLLTAFGMIRFIRGFAVGEASVIGPTEYVRLIFAAAFGFFLFGEVPDVWTIVGALIIVGSTCFIAQGEARKKGRGGPASG